MPDLEKGALTEGLKRLATNTASPTTAPQAPRKVETSEPIVRRLGAGQFARRAGTVPHDPSGNTVVAHPIGAEVHDEKYGPGTIAGHRVEQVGGKPQLRYHIKFASGKEFHAHHDQIAPAGAKGPGVNARMVVKSQGDGMDDVKEEGLLARLGSLIKGKPAMVPPPGDDDDEDDGPPAPSQEDLDKKAAPKKGAPPGGPAGGPPGADGGKDADDDDADGDGEPDEDDDDDGKDADGDGSDADDEGDEQDPTDEDDEQDSSDDNAALRRKVLQRSQDDPDFFKSLIEGDDTGHVQELIDESDAVVFMVQTFSEALAAERQANTALAKSLEALGARLDRAEQATEVVLAALEKSLLNDEVLFKSLGEQDALLKSIEATPTAKVATGLGALRTPTRRDPEGDNPAANQPSKSVVRTALLKSGDILGRELAGNLMAELDTVGVAGVLAKIGPNERFTALLK